MLVGERYVIHNYRRKTRGQRVSRAPEKEKPGNSNVQDTGTAAGGQAT